MKNQITKSLLLFTMLFAASTSFAIETMVAPPVNDLIENAIDIDGGPFPYSEVGVTFMEATAQGDATVGDCSVFLAGIWYKFTATSNGSVTASIANPQVPYIVFFTGPDENVTNGNQLTFVNQPSNTCAIANTITIDATAGITYYIYMRNAGNSDVAINANAALVPANDLIENATDLSLGPLLFIDENVNFEETTNTNDGGQTGCDTVDAGIWYKFTATAEGEVAAGLTNQVNGAVIFYSAPNGNATSGAELTFVDQGTNLCDYGDFSLITTTVGTTYYIFVQNSETSSVLINTEEIFAPPANDLVENAISLNGLEDYFDQGVHFLAATSDNDGGQAVCDTFTTKAVWYKFTATIDGQVVAGISLPNGAGGVVFYSAADENATSGADLTWVDQPTNECAVVNLSSIMATAGTTYYLLAGVVGNDPKADISVNLSGILGVGEQTINGLTYYPNPVKNEIHLSAKTTLESISIYNILGQQVYSEKGSETRRTIELSFLDAGLYVITVSSEGTTESFKVVKQ